MKTSQKGLDLLAKREGIRTKAYKDTKGIWTIGIGHTGPEVTPSLVWDDLQVMKAFAEDIKWAEAAVNAVKAPLTQTQFDALVSFVFNIGARAFERSTMKRLLDKGMYEESAEQFDRWHIPPEIVGRRNSEKKQFQSS